MVADTAACCVWLDGQAKAKLDRRTLSSSQDSGAQVKRTGTTLHMQRCWLQGNEIHGVRCCDGGLVQAEHCNCTGNKTAGYYAGHSGVLKLAQSSSYGDEHGACVSLEQVRVQEHTLWLCLSESNQEPHRKLDHEELRGCAMLAWVEYAVCR